MACDDEGSSTIVVLLNMRPCSESTEDMDTWIKYLFDSGARAAAHIIKESGDGKWDEWVTSTSPRAGVDGLRRPSGQAQTAGGIVRFVVRRGAPSDLDVIEKLKMNESGIPHGMAFVISCISLSHSARELMKVDPMATHRSKPDDFHRLFANTLEMQHVIQVVRAGMDNLQSGTTHDVKRRRFSSPHVTWGVLGELLTMCARTPSESAGVADSDSMRSTAWNPADLRSNRPANPEDLLAKGCRCADKYYKFPQWLHHGCPVGILRPKAATDFNHNMESFLATLRHDTLFQVLSSLRVHPIWQSHVHRGVIPEDDPTAFRVAATFQATSAPVGWHATDKYRAAFAIQTADIQKLSLNKDSRATTNLVWNQGCLLFVKSAPLSKAGKWRITLAPASPITGDVVLVILQWLGNMFFAQEAVRRAVMMAACSPLDCIVSADSTRPSGENILRDMISDDVIESYVGTSGVQVDPEQWAILQQINMSEQPLFCIKALAGAGKTAIAHCILHAFLVGNSASDRPRRLAIFTVPTRELREEVVLDLIRSKVRILLLHSTCGSAVHSKVVELSCFAFVGQVVTEDQIFWFGRPAHAPRMFDREDLLNAEVKRHQSDAYQELSLLQKQMTEDLASLSELVGDRDLSPAHPKIADIRQLTCRLKESCAVHIIIEITRIASTHDDILEKILEDVRVIVSTADGALKLFANLAVGPCKVLLTKCKVDLAIIDEGQRAELLPGCGILGHISTALVLADNNQCIPPPRNYATRSPWRQRIGDQDDPRCSTLQNPMPIWLPEVLAHDQHPHAHVFKLSSCKRCGDAITGFLKSIFPEFLSDFVSSPVAPKSVLQLCFYSGENWYDAQSMPNFTPTAKSDPRAVSWHDLLFRGIGSLVLTQLLTADQEHDEGTEFETKRMIVCVWPAICTERRRRLLHSWSMWWGKHRSEVSSSMSRPPTAKSVLWTR